MKPILTLVFLLSFAPVPTCSAQLFSVRVVDVRNGHPFPVQTITIQYRKMVGGQIEFETFTIKTDANGQAAFQLPNPTPASFSVTAYDLYPCFDLLPYDTQQLREFGINSHCVKPNQGCRCKFSRQANQIKATPGQVVLLARPFTRWEKFLEHIWE